MKRAIAVPVFVAILLVAPRAYADKLAPQQGVLQPPPAHAAPDVSHSITRAESPSDAQNIQTSQEEQQSSAQNSAPSASHPISAAEIVLILAALALVAAGIGQWVKSLGQ